ncbi:MAG: protein of unknown function endonuclease, partial [Actinomycetia bacterium]|nr:protein of unknown function endonuclease [Actinomycetes bacterium]
MAVRQLQLVVRELDVAALTGPEAVELLDLFAEAERVCSAGKALVAGRAAETNQWRGGTDRTAADWLANRTGTTAGQARKSLETAERVRKLPRSDEALRSGKLSLDQAAAVTDGAAADPSAEEELLNAASRESVRELRGRAERIKAAAIDESERHEAIRRKRSAREWIGDDGAWHLHLKGTKDAGATFMARHRPFVDAEFKRARKEGRREPLEAYAFDGMMAMAEAAASGGDGKAPSPVKVILRADLPAILRGDTEPGEVCEITGYGPIPVSVARELLPGSFLTLVLTKGVDVINVTHLGRQFTAHQQTALEWSDDQCQVLGCAEHRRLERDHRTEWSVTHHTRTDDADHMCKFHHWLK